MVGDKIDKSGDFATCWVWKNLAAAHVGMHIWYKCLRSYYHMSIILLFSGTIIKIENQSWPLLVCLTAKTWMKTYIDIY